MARDRRKVILDAVNELAHEAERLPYGWEIELKFGRDEATLSLFDPSGDEREVYTDCVSTFAQAIDDAIEFAKGGA